MNYFKQRISGIVLLGTILIQHKHARVSKYKVNIFKLSGADFGHGDISAIMREKTLTFLQIRVRKDPFLQTSLLNIQSESCRKSP